MDGGGVNRGGGDSGNRDGGGGGGGNENSRGGGITSRCDSTLTAQKRATTRVNTGDSIRITQQLNRIFFFLQENCFFTPYSHLQ